MKQIKYFFHFAAALLVVQLFFTGCQERDIESYQDDPMVYFLYETTLSGQKDSINHSFFGKHSSVERDTLTVYVKLSGKGHDYDRTFTVRQSNAGAQGAAVEGLHFVPLDNEYVSNSMTIKANEFTGAMKIIILKYENEDDPANSLDLNSKKLELELVANEHFRPGMTAQRRKFSISTTSLATKPTTWDTEWSPTFGATWGSVKFQFIIDHTGFMAWDEPRPADNNFMKWMRETVAKAFYDYNEANPDNPLTEANGEVVKFL